MEIDYTSFDFNFQNTGQLRFRPNQNSIITINLGTFLGNAL